MGHKEQCQLSFDKVIAKPGIARLMINAHCKDQNTDLPRYREELYEYPYGIGENKGKQTFLE